MKTDMQGIQPVILCGGSGTRLWPLSRGMHPKQFMDIGGDTLFAQSVARSVALPGSKPPIVVCNEQHRFFVAATLHAQGVVPGREAAARATIVLEPVGRNTAPAIALSAFAAMEEGHDPLLLVLSSDHAIAPQEAFARAVFMAQGGALAERLVAFGVPPTRPESGFGYIQQGEEITPGVFAVIRFVEKPDTIMAKALLSEGGFLWNSGMFLFRASLFLEELAIHAPEIHATCATAWESKRRDLDFIRLAECDFSACPSVSVDYAVMEHTDKACVVPLDTAWSDLGSWEAFYEISPKDDDENALVGDVVQLDSHGCYLHAGHRLVATVGLDNMAVVETADAVLVLPVNRSQDVKLLLAELKKRKRPETDMHMRVYRPWGSYEVLAMGERFQVKRIIVIPGGILSLQMHHHRAEHWVVVSGTARITVGDNTFMLKEDQSGYIPLGVKHRLENPGCIALEIIEIQTGSYLGEDDIIRLEDTYGRVY